MTDIVEAFQKRVAKHPQTIAIQHPGDSYSYEALELAAAGLAARIRAASNESQPRVLILLSRSPSAYIGMLGSLFAGGTFCAIPLRTDRGTGTDEYPPERVLQFVAAFRPHLILREVGSHPTVEALPRDIGRLIVSDFGTERLVAATEASSATAYVVFTSGSSGQPKGVEIGRRAFSHFLQAAQSYFAITEGERWGQFSSLAHDLAVMDVFLALSQGATLVPLNWTETQRPALAIKKHAIQVWQSVPSALDLMMAANQLTTENLSSLRLMSFCGEPLLRRHLDYLFSVCPALTVFNTYGATETVGFNTLNRLTALDYMESCSGPRVAIGNDIPGWTVAISQGTSALEGEILVKGQHLALGYLDDPARTSPSFRPGTPSSDPSRVYFTGDCGVRLDGNLYCFGRLDRQVKIRGERIELDEIDHFLGKAGFPVAFTVCVDDTLYSFVESTGAIDRAAVRAYLAVYLPTWSLPKEIIPVGEMPRRPSGKIDRRALEARVSQ